MLQPKNGSDIVINAQLFSVERLLFLNLVYNEKKPIDFSSGDNLYMVWETFRCTEICNASSGYTRNLIIQY